MRETVGDNHGTVWYALEEIWWPRRQRGRNGWPRRKCLQKELQAVKRNKVLGGEHCEKVGKTLDRKGPGNLPSLQLQGAGSERKSRTLSPVSRFDVSTRMDPSDPKSFNHRSVTLNTGRKYHYVDQLPKNYIPDKSLTLLLVHGFPDFWYGTQM